ncbi:hypothetical protein N0V86_005285 [Didymella sp. IMI 355093]|nr:hypothetical protein N0V86_005285 [Didymella sp. IMI 355093]
MAGGPPQQGSTYFETSYRGHLLYPTNLVYRASYRKVLESYKKRLDQASPDLFFKEGTAKKLDVRFRDYSETEKRFNEIPENYVRDRSSLQVYLGDDSTQTIFRLVKQDPRCRYIQIYSDVNRLQLKISREMTTLLFSFHQVMPSYLDFVSVFGLQINQREIRFSGFYEQSTLSVSPTKRAEVPPLNRSGRGYQLCYNLKAIVDKGEKEKDRWSIRQAAIHHQFDVEKGTALWICTEGRKAEGLFDRIRDLTSDPKRPEDYSYGTTDEAIRSSLATHLTCCHWSVEEWRTYMAWLEETVRRETKAAVDGDRNRRPGVTRKTYSSEDLQLVQVYEDKVSEVIMILEANNEVMQSLAGFYSNLMKNDDLDQNLRKQCAEDVREFTAQVTDMMYDSNMQIRRAKLLVKLTADRKALVRIAPIAAITGILMSAQILQHLQGQATEATLNLTIMSYKEAIIMRIITIVTLIFLPATFVSVSPRLGLSMKTLLIWRQTFFSTDIVKYQGQDENGTFSKTAMFRWLQVTLPLSALTLGVGYAWYLYQTKKSKKKGLYVLPY